MVEKKTIMLACSAGMSTSILVQRMQHEADTRKLDLNILAIPTIEATSRWKTASVLLLGPQVRYELDQFKKRINNAIPVEVINQFDYGMGNGAQVLDFALDLMKTKPSE